MRMLFVAVLALGSLPVAHAEDAKAVLEWALKSHGGADKLAKVQAQSWKSKGKMVAAGQSIEYTAEYHLLNPMKMRFDMSMEFGGMKVNISAATDGTTAWESSGDMVREMTKEKTAEFNHNTYVMHVTQLFPLQDKAYTLTTLPDIKVGDQTLVGIKAAHAGRRDVSLFFDKKTGLLARTKTQVIDEFQNKEVTQETIVSGWRELDGFKVFDKIVIQRDGKDFIIEEFSAQKMLDKGDDKLFVKPKGKP